MCEKATKTLSHSSAGTGAANHLAGEWFNSVAGIDLQHVPFKGDGAAIIDLMEGRVQIGFLTPNVALPQIKAGKLRAIAVTSSTAKDYLPGVPTMKQSGYSSFTVELFSGLVGRAGTPPEVVSRLNREINEVMKDPDLQAKLSSAALHPISRTPEEFRTLIDQQQKHWRGVVKQAGIPQED